MSADRAPARAGASGRTSLRRRAREFVLQGLYQRQLSGNSAAAIREQIAEAAGFARTDQAYFDELWRGTCSDYEALILACAPHLARKAEELSPIERAILVIGAWELTHRLEIPYRVVINEAVELAKSYGGTDGYKFVNGVLDRLAAEIRATEIAALPRAGEPGVADAA